MSSHRFVLATLTLCIPSVSFPQMEHRGPDQRTIEISATEKVRVPAGTATIKIGFQNQAATKDVAYAENTRAANKILRALFDAGVPKEAIETETLNLGQEQEKYDGRSNSQLKYTASQKWQIRSKAAEAQKVVDIAVAAGANISNRLTGRSPTINSWKRGHTPPLLNAQRNSQNRLPHNLA